jgi:hypothetical protein
MFREDAAQHYPVTRATWGFSKRNRYSIPVLCMAVETERQPSTFSEEDAWPHAPAWRLDVWARGLTPDLLRRGTQFRIPGFHDDLTGVLFTNFYYDEHEGTTDNVLTITQRDGEHLDLSIEGFIRHEFASMRPTRITVDARFGRLSPHEAIPAAYYREALPPHEPPYGATILQTEAT